MKVFISWSGERSHRVALLVQLWLKRVVQALEPWVSSSDIESGAVWFSKITNELSTTNQSIICLTRENKDKPWILFEAGALAKEIENARVYTLLIDLEAVDIQDPLAQFNHTRLTKGEMHKLISNINGRLDSRPLDQSMLDGVFETYWPWFEADFKKIIDETEGTAPAEVSRTVEDMLAEILNSVRTIDKRVGAIESFSPQIIDNSGLHQFNPLMHNQVKHGYITGKYGLTYGGEGKAMDNNKISLLMRQGYSDDYIIGLFLKENLSVSIDAATVLVAEVRKQMPD